MHCRIVTAPLAFITRGEYPSPSCDNQKWLQNCQRSLSYRHSFKDTLPLLLLPLLPIPYSGSGARDAEETRERMRGLGTLTSDHTRAQSKKHKAPKGEHK